MHCRHYLIIRFLRCNFLCLKCTFSFVPCAVVLFFISSVFSLNICDCVSGSWTDLVCLCGLVHHDGPGLSIITVSHFEGHDKLDGAKVFGPLCDDSCDLLGRQQVHLRTQKQLHFTKASLGKLKTTCSCVLCSVPTCSHSDRLLVAAVQAFVLPCLSSRA